ncbi:methyltransferase [Paenibacillus selenitireducens]|uniref:Methyltransferase n=1 Tax=Paenibacillus selenitireducens TaxID=1324314 RepID=A0A1T2XMK1_9BACL|nr:O-methyltransferase [Paenibacillus selenitireducens]OPA81099.1 methyltransferase [Paenibacillus selenitireducens]
MELIQSDEQYMDALYREDPMLEQVMAGIREAGMPEISIAPGYGRLLTILVKTSRAKRILEIGALGGYSGICLARGLDSDGELVSLELKEEFAAIAERHVQVAGYGEQVTYRIGDAMDSLKQLEEEGQKFDFFFIDADKGNYLNYLEYAITLSNPGALIVGDNTLLRGRTTDPSKNGPSVQAVRLFNEKIAQDPRLMSTMLPAYDGLAIAMVK